MFRYLLFSANFNKCVNYYQVIECLVFYIVFFSIEYWFRCMDLDGDGIISMYEMDYCYTEQLEQMQCIGYIYIHIDI